MNISQAVDKEMGLDQNGRRDEYVQLLAKVAENQ
jgi:hypothetical protein